MATKRILTTIKIELAAGEANPAKVGQTLGPHGANIMVFCRDYNAATRAQRGTIVPAVITVYEDRSHDFVLKTPPTAALLRRAAGLERGGAQPGRLSAGTVTRAQLRAVAAAKLPDLNTGDLDAAERVVAGTARSMGLRVEG